MKYSITKQIRLHHEDGWFYQFTDDGEGSIEVTPHTIEECKSGEGFYIPKDCLNEFIQILSELK